MTKRIVRTADDLPRDHWIARQLPAGTSLRPFAEDEAVSALTSAAQDAIDDAGLTRTEVAQLLGTTKSYISQVLNGSTNMTLKTLGALLWAAGRQVHQLKTVSVGGEVRTAESEQIVIKTSSGVGRFVTFHADAITIASVRRFNAVTTIATPH